MEQFNAAELSIGNFIMAKASIRLVGGTSVEIDGSPEEVSRILALYDGNRTGSTPKQLRRTKAPTPKSIDAPVPASDIGTSPDLPEIVNLIKSCDEAEAIDAKILDKANQLGRILLPLYIVHDHLGDAYGLTSGEINQITKELGIPISRSNASTTLSGVASRYVVGDKIRRKGQAVRYKISRRGIQYLKGVLAGAADKK